MSLTVNEILPFSKLQEGTLNSTDTIVKTDTNGADTKVSIAKLKTYLLGNASYLPLSGGTISGNLTLNNGSVDINSYTTDIDCKKNGTNIGKIKIGYNGGSADSEIYLGRRTSKKDNTTVNGTSTFVRGKSLELSSDDNFIMKSYGYSNIEFEGTGEVTVDLSGNKFHLDSEAEFYTTSKISLETRDVNIYGTNEAELRSDNGTVKVEGKYVAIGNGYSGESILIGNQSRTGLLKISNGGQIVIGGNEDVSGSISIGCDELGFYRDADVYVGGQRDLYLGNKDNSHWIRVMTGAKIHGNLYGYSSFSNNSDPDTDDCHWKIENDGSAYFTTVGTISKRSSKTDIVETEHKNATDEISLIKIVDFYYKNDEKKENRKIGFIADDTAEVFATKNHDQMDMQNCIGMLLKAVQELSSRITELERRA